LRGRRSSRSLLLGACWRLRVQRRSGLGCRLLLLPMTICSERWLGLGLSLDVRSESNHAFSGIHLFVSCMTDGFQRACLCRGKFLFLNPGRVLSPLEPVLGEITGLSLITGLSVVFSSCRVGALQVCKTRRPGPPPGLLIQAYSGAIFQIRYSPKELFCVVRVYALATSWLVTGLVTVDGNSKGRGRGFS